MLPWHFLNPNGKLKLIFSGLPVSSSACKELPSPHSIWTSGKLNRQKNRVVLGSITEAREQGKLLSPRLKTQGIQWVTGAETSEQKLPWEPAPAEEARTIIQELRQTTLRVEVGPSNRQASQYHEIYLHIMCSCREKLAWVMLKVKGHNVKSQSEHQNPTGQGCWNHQIRNFKWQWRIR